MCRQWIGLSFLVAAMLTAACSGGTNSIASTPAVSNRQALPDAHKHRRGRVRITIKIPRKPFKIALPIGVSNHRRHRKYISPSTQSMSIATTAGATQTFNLTPTSRGCSGGSGSTTCSVTAFFPPGKQTITISLYDGLGGSGNMLSTASEQVTITAGAVTNISITLQGVPVTASVLLNGAANDGIPKGTPTSVPVSVTAKDADGNIIMLPGKYTTPITLSDSDTSGATTLSTASAKAPSAAITLSYNGAAISSATITPSIAGTPQPAGAATLTLNPTLTEPLLYVGEFDFESGTPSVVEAYSPTSFDLAGTLSVNGLSGIKGLAVDQSKNLYVTCYLCPGLYVFEPGQTSPSESYTFNDDGSSGVAVSGTTVYVAGFQSGNIYEFTIGNTTTPSATIAVTGGAGNMAVDGNNDLFFTTYNGTMDVEELTNGSTAPQDTGINTGGYNAPLAIDAAGDLLVGESTGTIAIYASGSTTASKTISVPSAPIQGMTFDSSDGALFVSTGTSASAGTVYEFSYPEDTEVNSFTGSYAFTGIADSPPLTPGTWR